MKCPRTHQELKAITINNIEINLSTGCGGVWFDRFELEKFDEIHEEAGALLIEHMKNFHRLLPDTSARLKCPKDPDVVMMRRYYSSKHQIEIDECPQCGGIWLDAEELAGIRALFPTQNDLKKDKKEFVEKIMASKEVQAYEQKSHELPNTLDNISNLLWSMLRFGR